MRRWHTLTVCNKFYAEEIGILPEVPELQLGTRNMRTKNPLRRYKQQQEQ
jgi:hypothetical protein